MLAADNFDLPGSAARTAAHDTSTRTVQHDDAGDEPGRPSRRLFTTVLPPLTATRTLRGAPDDLITMTVCVWHAPPFNLRLLRAIGPHPVDGGVLVFEVPAYRAGVDGAGFGIFPYSMMRLDIRELFWTMRRDADDALACTLTADLAGVLQHGRRVCVVQAFCLGFSGLALGSAVTWEAGWRATSLAALLAALLLMLLGRWLLPRAFAHTLRRARDLLDGLLAEVAVHQGTQAVLDDLPPPR